MTYEEKKTLYEELMKSIAPVIKQLINEYSNIDNSEFVLMPGDKEIDKFILSWINDLNISSLSNNAIDELKVDYEECYQIYKVYHRGPEYVPIYESLKDEITDLKNSLGRIYNFQSWQVEVKDFNDVGFEMPYVKFNYKPAEFIDIIIADINNNKKIITDFLNEREFVLLREVYEIVNDFSVVHLLFTPSKQENIAEQIYSNFKYLYHLTPSLNLERILKIGLTPKLRQGESFIYYPPRIYFSTDYDFLNKYKSTMELDHKTNDFSILKIDIQKLNKYNDFYWDPLFGKPFIYTNRSVFPNAISKIDENK